MGKRLGVFVRAILVEAEPKHLEYMREAILLSGTPMAQVGLLHRHFSFFLSHANDACVCR